jgi:hypothetical protein
MSATAIRDDGRQPIAAAPRLPSGGHGLSNRERDARLHDAAVELMAAELPSLARAVLEARRRLGLLRGGRK